MKRSPLKPRSEKTAKLYREKRVPFVQKILSERPWCEACSITPVGHRGRRPSTDVHEILTRGRSGGVHGSAWLDEENVLALCRTCHTWITDHPKEAKELDLVRESTK